MRITAVGASITSGAGGREWERTRTNWPGYVSQFADWMRAAFPRANATVHNAGMAGTFSGVFAQCFDTLIPPADIYILEQTTFDGTEPERCYCKDHYVNTPVQVCGRGRSIMPMSVPRPKAGIGGPAGTRLFGAAHAMLLRIYSEQVHPHPQLLCQSWRIVPALQLGIERLIRRMLKQPHQPAVIMLNTYGFRFPNREVYQRVSSSEPCAKRWEGQGIRQGGVRCLHEGGV